LRSNFNASRTSFLIAIVLGLAIGAARADDPKKPSFPIPRLSAAMRRVEGFIQARPRDGEPATQKTEVDVFADQAWLLDSIARVKCNWQFNREWSLRSLVQTSAPHTKDVNTEVLLTWLKHPGTAVSVGYNTHASNLAPYEPDFPGSTRPGLVGDGRRLFVKFTYQFRL